MLQASPARLALDLEALAHEIGVRLAGTPGERAKAVLSGPHSARMRPRPGFWGRQPPRFSWTSPVTGGIIRPHRGTAGRVRARRFRDCSRAWRGRDGRSVSRARSSVESQRRGQGASSRPKPGAASTHAVRAGGAVRVGSESYEYLPHLPPWRDGRRPTLYRD